MKANFPAIYMCAVLSAESGDTEKIAEIVTECKRMGIPILPPDVNESFSQFTVIKDAEASKKQVHLCGGSASIASTGFPGKNQVPRKMYLLTCSRRAIFISHPLRPCDD